MDVYDDDDGRPDPPHLSIAQMLALIVAMGGALALLVGAILVEDQSNRVEREIARKF